MRWPLFTSGAFLLVASSPLAAQDLRSSHGFEGPHVDLGAGLLLIEDPDGPDAGSHVKLDYAPALVFGLHAGRQFVTLRPTLEFEYAHAGGDRITAQGRSEDVDGDFDLYRFTAGLYYDVDNWTRYTPYIGGGLGAVYVNRDDLTFGGGNFAINDDTYLTAHGEVGLAVRITDDFSLVPAYRFFWTEDSVTSEDDTAHILELGVRARF